MFIRGYRAEMEFRKTPAYDEYLTAKAKPFRP